MTGNLAKWANEIAVGTALTGAPAQIPAFVANVPGLSTYTGLDERTARGVRWLTLGQCGRTEVATSLRYPLLPETRPIDRSAHYRHPHRGQQTERSAARPRPAMEGGDQVSDLRN